MTNGARKPRPDFPLFPHATGRWAKKVRGKFEYFGSVKDDPKGERALNEWVDQRDNLLAGRQRRTKTGELTVRDLCNKLLNSKRVQMQTGNVKLVSLRMWMHVCRNVVKFFGAGRAVEDVTPEDFQAFMETLTEYSPSTRSEWVTYVRALFRFAHNDDQHLIPKPVLFGPAFHRCKPVPGRRSQQRRAFTAEEIHKILSVSNERANGRMRTGGPMRAMILLAVNCGFGNNDCATLKFSDLDLETGWHNHWRPKTGVRRRCPLWPETLAAINDWLKVRTRPKIESDSDLVFLTDAGLPFVRLTENSAERFADGEVYAISVQNTVGRMFSKILRERAIWREGLSFYSFRHTFRTIGGGAKDTEAVDLMMGHITPGMGTKYRDKIEDEQLRAVSDHVRAWLFGPNVQNEKKAS